MTYAGGGGCCVTGSVPDGGISGLSAAERGNYNDHK
jgi:hypothetical protein